MCEGEKFLLFLRKNVMCEGEKILPFLREKCYVMGIGFSCF